MKRLFSLLAIVAIIAVSNCSEIPENNDPILGAWIKTTNLENSTTDKSAQIEEEWIFNDVYLGRYQRYQNGKITFYTDYRWSVEQGIYSLEYNEEEMSDISFLLKEGGTPEVLELPSGSVFAIRK